MINHKPYGGLPVPQAHQPPTPPGKPSGRNFNRPVDADPVHDPTNFPANRVRLLPGNQAPAGIRRFGPDDVPLLFEAVRESVDELCNFMTWCRPDYSQEDSRTFIANCGPNWAAGEQYSFAIFDVRDQTLLGSVGLNRIDRTHRCANIGYWVRRSHTQRGVATAATRLIARVGLMELGFRRLEILVPGKNVASQRVAQKAGAQFEGVLRQRLMFADGFQDALLYSLVPEDLHP